MNWCWLFQNAYLFLKNLTPFRNKYNRIVIKLDDLSFLFSFLRPFSLIANLSNLLNYLPKACIINKYLITLSYFFFSRVEWGRKYLQGANMCRSTLVLFKLFLVSRSLSLSQARKRYWWDIFCSFLWKPKGKKRGWYVYIFMLNKWYVDYFAHDVNNTWW